MKSITVAELRQNLTAMLDDVAAGESYRITRHGREVGRILPPDEAPPLIPESARHDATHGAARPRAAESADDRRTARRDEGRVVSVDRYYLDTSVAVHALLGHSQSAAA